MLRDKKRTYLQSFRGVKLPEGNQLTSNLDEKLAMDQTRMYWYWQFRPLLQEAQHKQLAPYVRQGQIVVNVAKGVEEHTLMTLSRDY